MSKAADIEAVLVTSSGISTSPATSGVLLGRKYVITSGIVLVPFLRDQNGNGKCWDTFSSDLQWANEPLSSLKFRVWREVDDSNGKRNRRIPSLGRLLAYWKCNLVANSLKTCFQDWKFINGLNSNTSEDMGTPLESLSTFVVLESGGGLQDKAENLKGDMIDWLVKVFKNTVVVGRGETIEVVSTPFGNEAFLNSVSRGIVNNVVGLEKCLVLIDARTVPGCEGGPIFTCYKSRFRFTSEKKLIGLVMCPISWWRGEWVGLTVGVNLFPVFRRLLTVEKKVLDPTNGPFAEETDAVDDMDTIDRIVVLVRCGSAWGSGVVLNANTVITCSHVVKTGGTVSIFHRNCSDEASVIYRTPDDVAYDLAILKLQNGNLEEKLRYSKEPAKIGDEVLAVGYPFFTNEDVNSLRATLVRGTVAKVHPSMIESTCCIQSGFSGGALLKNGKLIGIIICNVKDSSSGALYPQVNFAVPFGVFRHVVTAYIETNDVAVLESLESRDVHVQALWSLGMSKL